jgi:hypothetical protein
MFSLFLFVMLPACHAGCHTIPLLTVLSPSPLTSINAGLTVLLQVGP